MSKSPLPQPPSSLSAAAGEYTDFRGNDSDHNTGRYEGPPAMQGGGGGGFSTATKSRQQHHLEIDGSAAVREVINARIGKKHRNGRCDNDEDGGIDGSDTEEEVEANNAAVRRRSDAIAWLILVINCLLLGPLNFVSYKVLYTAYTEPRAFFVSQGVNVVYVLLGGIFLALAEYKGEITDDMRRISHWKYVVMGGLDCLAGFLSAMGASNTSGAVIQILNQALIPCTMIASWIMLKNRSSLLQIFGSFVILSGAVTVLWPSLSQPGGQSSYPFSAVIYFCSNIPFAASYCYKEYGFKNLSIHVLYLTQWVSVYQLLIGFLLAPLQMIPGMGSKDGMTFQEIIYSFSSGFSCMMESNDECRNKHAFGLLVGYCATNFVFNTLGLFLVKKGSATLVSISYAIILPVTTMAFTLPVLGQYQEPFQATTFLGLIITLIGFFVWKAESLECFDKFTEFVYMRVYDLFGYNEINQQGDDTYDEVKSTTSNPLTTSTTVSSSSPVPSSSSSPYDLSSNSLENRSYNEDTGKGHRSKVKTSVKQRLTTLAAASSRSSSPRSGTTSFLDYEYDNMGYNNDLDIETTATPTSDKDKERDRNRDSSQQPDKLSLGPISFQHGDHAALDKIDSNGRISNESLYSHNSSSNDSITGEKKPGNKDRIRTNSFVSSYLRRSLSVGIQQQSSAPDSFSERTLVIGPLI